MPLIPKLLSEVISMGGLIVDKRRATDSLFNPRCHLHQVHLGKFPERIKITKVVTSALTRGSLPNLYQLNAYRTI